MDTPPKPTPNPTPTPPPEPPPTPAQPVPEPPQEPTPEPGPQPEPLFKGDALVAALGLPPVNPVEEPEPTPPTPEPEPNPTPAPSPAPPEPPQPARRKRSSVVKVQLDAPPVPAPTPEPPPPAPVTPPPRAIDPDEAYVDGLTDEQKEELREAAKAEEMFPERYKGRRKQLIAWYKSLDSKATEWIAADPNRKLDESDEEFRKFVSTKPAVATSHSKAVQRAIAKEEAVADVEKKLAPELERQRRDHLAIKRQPRIDQIRSQFIQGTTDEIEKQENSPVGEALRAIKADPSAAEHYAMEKSIFDEEMERSANMAAEYCKFIPQYENGKLVDPGIQFDETNPLHNEIFEFVKSQGEGFAKMNTPEAQKLKVKDGKTFLPRSEYLALSEAQQRKHWTFNHQDIVNIMAVDAKIRADARIKGQDAYNRKMGYERKPRKNSAQPPNPPTPPTPPQPIEPPRAVPSRGKVVGTPAPTPPTAPKGGSIDVSETLGYNKLTKSVVS